MKVNFPLFLMIICVCQSCGFVHEEKIIGNFYLIAVDTNNDMDLSYRLNNGDYLGVIPAVVFSVGYDSNYVFAKQHPEGANGKTNYFIVPIKIKNQYKVEEEVVGPLNENQFYKKLDELKVLNTSNLFQITIENI